MSPTNTLGPLELLPCRLCASLSSTRYSLLHLSQNRLMVRLRCLVRQVRVSGVTSNSLESWSEWSGAFGQRSGGKEHPLKNTSPPWSLWDIEIPFHLSDNSICGLKCFPIVGQHPLRVSSSGNKKFEASKEGRS